MKTTATHQQHIWKKWSASGALAQPQPPYVHRVIMNPPPSWEVQQVIGKITGILTRLKTAIEKRIKMTGLHSLDRIASYKLSKLLKEVTDARYMTNISEYHLGIEYLDYVTPKGNCHLEPDIAKLDLPKYSNPLILTKDGVIKRIILEVVSLLRWCEENDRRSSYLLTRNAA